MENQIEIWKDIPGYEGLYLVSNYGHTQLAAAYNCSHQNIRNIVIRNKWGHI